MALPGTAREGRHCEPPLLRRRGNLIICNL